MKIEVIHRPAEGENPFPYPLLFIHGSYCAAWVWDEHFLPYLASQGFDAYALSLRGHGASEGHTLLKRARITDLLADVERVAASLPAAPILLGHSLGGGLVEKYLEKHPQAKAGVLIAPAPYGGIFTSAFHMLQANPKPIFQALRQRNFTVLSDSVTRAHMMASIVPDQRAVYLERLEKEEAVRAIIDLEFMKANPHKIHVPLLLIGGESDQMVYPWQIRRTGVVFHTEPVFFPCMGHEMMLEPGWKAVADTILEWLWQQNFSKFSE